MQPGPAVLLPAQWARSRTHCASSFPAGLPGAGVSSLTRHGRRRLLPRSVREAEDSRGRRRIPAERRERRVGGSPCGEELQAASRSGLRRSPRSSLFPEDPRERPGRGPLSASVTRCAKFKRTRWVLSGVTDSGVSRCCALSGRYPGAQDPHGPKHQGPAEMTRCVQGSGPPRVSPGCWGLAWCKLETQRSELSIQIIENNCDSFSIIWTVFHFFH